MKKITYQSNLLAVCKWVNEQLHKLFLKHSLQNLSLKNITLDMFLLAMLFSICTMAQTSTPPLVFTQNGEIQDANHLPLPLVVEYDFYNNKYEAIAVKGASCDYNMRVTKTNSVGTIQWTYDFSYGFNSDDIPTGIHVTPSGEVYITGTVKDYQTTHIITIALNLDGVEKWVQEFCEFYGFAAGADIYAIDGNNVYVTGSVEDGNGIGGSDYIIIKYNDNGNLQYYNVFSHWETDFAQTLTYDNTINKFILNGISQLNTNTTTWSNYTLDVRDAGSYFYINEVIIPGDTCTGPRNITYTINPISHLDLNSTYYNVCVGNTVNLTAPNGVSYSWWPSTGLSDSSIANPVATITNVGQYYYNVNINEGTCAYDKANFINVLPLPLANAGRDTAICNGNEVPLHGSTSNYYDYNWWCYYNVTGLGFVNTGTNLNLGYTWSPAMSLSDSSSYNPIATPTSSTTYTLTAGFAGCTTTDTVVVTVNNAPLPTANAGADVAICAGNSTQLTASGGTYYTWSPAIGLSDATIANPVANPTTTTTYSVRVDNGTCYSYDTVVVTVNPLPSVTLGSTYSFFCSGGSATLSASGGTSYSWSPSTGLSNPNSSNTTVSITTPQNTFIPYTVTVSNGTCTNTATAYIYVLALPTASITINSTVCQGNNKQLSVTNNVNNTYAWSPATSLSNATIYNPIATPTTTTTYTATITNANSCSITKSVVITVAANPIATASAVTPTICAGKSTQLTATGGGSYLWTPNTGLSSATTAAPTATPVATTTYTVKVTNAAGCSATATKTITVNPLPTANAGAGVSIFSGQTTPLSASGGTSYSWSPATGLSDANIANPVANPTSTTTYIATVFNANGCSASDNVDITVLPAPTVTADTIIVVGDSLELVATGGTSYLWTPSIGLSNATIANPIAKPSVTSNYSVAITTGLTTTMKSVAVIVYSQTEIPNSIQTTEPCGSEIELRKALEHNPQIQYEVKNIEEDYFNYYSLTNSSNISQQSNTLPNNEEITIPVVVHMIYPSGTTYGTGSNLSYARIENQIKSLNDAFKDSISGKSGKQTNTHIKFCLAQMPKGQDSLGVNVNFYKNGPTIEYGVVRHPIDTNNNLGIDLQKWKYENDNDLNNLYYKVTNPPNAKIHYFPKEEYLTIWVLPTLDSIHNGTPGLLGISTFPFGNNKPHEGVFMRSEAFGNADSGMATNFTQGKILVHEVGHYLGLYHIFDGACDEITYGYSSTYSGDKCLDTPPSKEVYYDCNQPNGNPSQNIAVCNNVSPTLHYEDYMSYAFNYCMNTFTKDQNTRIRYHLEKYRKRLFSNQNLIATGVKGVNKCTAPSLFSEFYYSGERCKNDTLLFNAVGGSANLAGSTSAHYVWSFQNGTPTTDTGLTASCKWASPGTYNVTLAVSANGVTKTSSQQITISTCTLSGSKEQANWFFGAFASLNFGLGKGIATPFNIASVPNNTIFTYRASVSVSDTTGSLLFYSNGYEVWNNQHKSINSSQSMWLYGKPGYLWNYSPFWNYNNGYYYSEPMPSGLDYHSSGAVSQLVSIPVPGSSTQHYIFKPPINSDPNKQKLVYAIVDMSIVNPSGGMGQIIKNDSIIFDNIRLTEMITTVKACDGSWWIILRGNDTLTNKDYSYVFNVSSGNLNLTSNHKLPNTNLKRYISYFSGDNLYRGTLKASPDGSKLAMVEGLTFYSQSLKGILLYNFNKLTGVVNDEFLLQDNDHNKYQGISFSPNSMYLFASSGNTNISKNLLIQFDLTQPKINWPIFNVVNNNNQYYGNLQLAPNGKIYVNTSNKKSVGSIDNPDVFPTNSYVNNSVDFSNLQNSQYIQTIWSFPCMNDAWNTSTKPVSISVTKTSCDTISCVVNTCINKTFKIDFGDTTSALLTTDTVNNAITHQYKHSGIYIVKCFSITNQLLDSSLIAININTNLPINQIGTNGCNKMDYSTISNLGYYTWKITGGYFIDLINNTQLTELKGISLNKVSVAWLGKGTITVTTKDGSCIKSGTYNFMSPFVVNAGNDITVNCMSNNVTLNAITTGASGGLITYSWTPINNIISGANNDTCIVTSITDTYTVLVTDANGCTASDNITINSIFNSSNTFIFGNTITPTDVANSGNKKYLLIPQNTVLSDIINFSNRDITIGNDVEISLAVNTNLTIHNSYLHGCNELWNSILFDKDRQQLKITNSLVEDAKNAVKIDQIPTNLEITNSIFNNNKCAIYYTTSNDNSNNSSLIASSIFTSRQFSKTETYSTLTQPSGTNLALDNYTPTVSLYDGTIGSVGVTIDNSTNYHNNPSMIQIGDTSYSPNIFDRLVCGVNSQYNALSCYNNKFRNIGYYNLAESNFYDGCGIATLYGTYSDSLSTKYLTYYLGGTNVKQGNSFYNVVNGMVVNGGNTKIINNNLVGIGDNYTGIYIDDLIYGATIIGNNIQSYLKSISVNTSNAYGNGYVNILNNTIWGARTSSIGDIHTGITVAGQANNYYSNTSIKCNTIKNQHIGIDATLVKGLIIENNPQITYPINENNTSGRPAMGINIKSCSGAIIKNNGWGATAAIGIGGDAFSGSSATTTPIGIMVESSKNTQLLKNKIRCASNAIKYQGICGTYGVSGTRMAENDLNYFTKGITLSAINGKGSMGIIMNVSANGQDKTVGTVPPSTATTCRPTGNIFGTTSWPSASTPIIRTRTENVENTYSKKAMYSPMIVGNAANEVVNGAFSEGAIPPFNAFADPSSYNCYISTLTKNAVGASNCSGYYGYEQIVWNAPILLPSWGGISTGNTGSFYDETTALEVINDAGWSNQTAYVADTANQWLLQQSMYQDIIDTTTTFSTALMQAFYDSVSTNNIGKYYALDTCIATGNFTTALSLLAGINPSNDIEAKMQRYYQIALEKGITADTVAIDSASVEDMATIAQLCPYEYGDVVYSARNLYNAIIGVAIDYSEFTCGIGFNPTARMAPEEEVEVTAKIEEEDLQNDTVNSESNLVNSNKLILSPNPNNGLFELIPTNVINDLVNISIYSSTGFVVKKSDSVKIEGILKLDCSNLSNGLYNLVINYADGTFESRKLVLIR